MGLVSELNRTRLIGQEFELFLPTLGNLGQRELQQSLANILNANGLRTVVRGYDRSPIPSGFDWACEVDSSIRAESPYAGITHVAIELKCRPVTYDEWEALVPKTLALLRFLNAKVNRSTGFHTHLSFPEAAHSARAIKSLWNTFYKVDDLLFALVAPSRRHSNYCQPLPEDQARLLNGCRTIRCCQRVLQGFTRYHGLNLTNLWDDSPRVEFRYHHGTLDTVKARIFVRMLLGLTQHAVTRNARAVDKLPATARGLERMLVSCGFKSNSKVYAKIAPELKETARQLRRTFRKFNSDGPLTGSRDHAPDGED
jgi:hypothetical protein